MPYRIFNLQMHRFGMGYFGMGYYWIVDIIFWILLLIGIVILIKYLLQKRDSSEILRQDSAIEILKKRYANGEIDKEEYEEKKKALTT